MNILYNTDEMRQGANHIQIKVGELKQILSNINSEINGISPNWEGKSKVEFITKYENSKNDINSYIDCILKISNQLQNIAKLVESTDDNISSGFSFMGR